ncbi:MAG TPA: NAD(P)H-dependent oxidoreductase [Saprospiraceae bacterium]|nr:NAD(P)H-dependent oxidoreductase [Saprospiraceae bacterium]HPN71199.1 NAD(P)H-dependent oxidoreductase [Saprospiraceae bacterium]
MKIIAFGASYSKTSINRAFAEYVAEQIEGAQTEVLDLNIYDLPLYTTEKEKEIGIPQGARDFVAKLDEADLLIISLAEHNGTYTTAFKNLFDWATRVKLQIFENKPMILLSTAPGPRGGLGVLEAAKVRFPIHGAKIVGAFSLPKFNENFEETSGVQDPILRDQLFELIHKASIEINEFAD